ncbi:hypothetical protein AKG60_19435 [Vibrio parahaemolyticus]|uniref:Uncharacterized protein n=1 Tax=Vibrio parahaemolyticus TaxID=670 RepID=A0AAX0M8W9_VIBPH|nr:hypothetical protein [Vibrio parahaemolyticus]MCS0328265.1 hypothetical protein [Vibrio diabolicus]EGQ8302214.1 hypothetical protein [Vibrio parahaemolyticus]EGQ8891522.1 hypothetical protein [Vibrio parahaemolyticus]EGR3308783.1 hypothetical protein [Vibrio parahaemolyticus]EJG0023023.1 hypothetical protein [Vibrio parahaemolyticus]
MKESVMSMKIGFINYDEDGAVESANRKGIYSDELNLLAREIIRELNQSKCVEVLIQHNAKIQVIKVSDHSMKYLEFNPSKDAFPIEMHLTTSEVDQEVLESQLASLLSETLEPFFSFYGNKKS